MTEVLAQSPDAAACAVRSLYRYALGHVERPTEEPAITQLASDFAAKGYQLDALIESLAVSEALRYAAKPEE
jgi:hypothetical protein